MRARTFSALCVVIAVVCGAVFLSGCASGHKQFVYAVGPGTNEVFEFRAQDNGSLAPLGTPNFAAGSGPVALAIHPSGDFLYIADFAGSNLTLLDISKSNGNLSVPVTTSVVQTVNPPNIFNTGAGPIAVGISPTAPFLYVANQASGDITAFTVDPGSGVLGLINTFTISPASKPQALAVSPKGDLLFVANSAQASVAVFSIGSKGGLTQVGAPVSMGAGATPNAITVEHSGRFLYVADTAHNAILGFAIQSGGALAPISGSPFAAGTQPAAVAADPQGALLYAANVGSNSVSGYVIDASTGALGPVTGSPFATGGVAPAALTVDTRTSVLYVMDQSSHDIAALLIGSNGALKPVTGSPFSVATAGTSIAVVLR
jgi:6-phosphogluconolactonase